MALLLIKGFCLQVDIWSFLKNLPFSSLLQRIVPLLIMTIMNFTNTTLRKEVWGSKPSSAHTGQDLSMGLSLLHTENLANKWLISRNHRKYCINIISKGKECSYTVIVSYPFFLLLWGDVVRLIQRADNLNLEKRPPLSLTFLPHPNLVFARLTLYL